METGDDKILEFIKEEDLTLEMKYLAEFIGLANVVKLMKYAGGTRLSIPSPESYKVIAVRRKIMHLGGRLDKLARIKLCREFSINERSLEQIIKEI